LQKKAGIGPVRAVVLPPELARGALIRLRASSDLAIDEFPILVRNLKRRQYNGSVTRRVQSEVLPLAG